MTHSDTTNDDTERKEGAWTVSSEAASEYLRARIPYQQFVIDTIFAYHEYSSKGKGEAKGKGKAKWDACLDLGCGPGQLGIHMSRRFKKIYGRDVSQQMIDIAKTLPHMDEEELQRVQLFKPKANRVFDFCVSSEYDLGIPDDSVDMIVIGSAVHWFDWSTPESSKKIWDEWCRVLRPNGSVFILTGMVVAGNCNGIDADKTRPLRRLLRFVPYIDEISRYWTLSQKKLGAGSMGSDLEMPWQIDPSTLQWDSSSRLFLLFDNPTDVDVEGQKVVKSDGMPDWMPLQIAKYANTNAAYDQLEERWKMTTPRKLANWLRSASGYVHYLRDHSEEKLRMGRDDDLAARLVKQACLEGGLGYDEAIELHYTDGILALRRNP